MSLLRRLDECIAYVGANPQYADALAYGARCKQLQVRPRAWYGLSRGQGACAGWHRFVSRPQL